MFAFAFGRGFTGERMTKDSQQLLAEFVEHHSDAAFRELVTRYLDLVYSTALRILAGNTSLAEDISQAVFASLARKAPTLSSKVMLGGWLHQHTYYLATRMLRAECRRQHHEREAVEMKTLMDDSNAHWRQLAPILDEAITELGGEDRAAILLRFFERRDFRSVGEAIGSSQDAARVRVNRALEKLRGLLARRGVTLSVGALGTLLAGEAVAAAPAGLALAISTAALAGAAAVGGGGAALTLLKLMATTKLKAGLVGLVLVGATTTALFEHHGKLVVQDEIQSLRQQVVQLQADNENLLRAARPGLALAPRLPAPPMPATPSANTLKTEQLPSVDLYALMTNRTSLVKLTADQAEAYLNQNGRNAVSLLSAFRTSDNPALLQEALQKYPDDPQVNFEAALFKDTSPADRRQYLDAFKKSAPANALAYYLSAADHFKAGQANEAVQDVIGASSKTEFHDYSVERTQADQEAYLAAGYPMAQADLLAAKQLALPQLLQARDLSGNLLDLAKSYQQNGDASSGQAALEMAASLGRHYSAAAPGESLVARLFGISVESAALRAMDPNSTYAGTGQFVQDRTAELAQQRSALRELSKQADPLWKTLSDQDWISYQNRSASLGEEAAIRWLVSKSSAK